MGNVLDSVTKRAGTIGALQGTLYEIQVIFLFMIRACLNNVKFTLANNIEGFGNFDDLVASCQLPDGTKKLICLQCKHLKDSGKTQINLGRLTDNKEKDFNLSKHREEILKAGSKISDYKDIDVDLIFYTTVAVDHNDTSLSWCNVDKNDILCKLLDTSDADNCVRVFSQPGNDVLVEKVANDQQFLEKITIFSCQCQEENIEAVIKKSLSQLVGNHEDDVIDNIYQNIKSELEKWFKNEIAETLGKERFISWIWTNVLKDATCFSVEKTLRKFSSTYNICADRKDELRNQLAEHKTLFIKSKNSSTFLAALEVYQAVEDDLNHMFVNLQDLKQVLPLFEYCKDLIIVNCPEVTQIVQKDIDELTKILDNNKNKKATFLVPNNVDVNFKYEKYIKYKFNFNSLTDKAQDHIKEREVKLQGINMQIRDLIDDEALGNILDCSTVEKLIKREVVEVGAKLPELDEETKKCYIERIYHNTHVLDKKLLDIETYIDVFVVCVDNASDLGTYQKTFVQYDDLNKNTNYKLYFTNESEETNSKILENIAAQYPGRNIHLLKPLQKYLVWMKTVGSVANIREYVTTCTLLNGAMSDAGENVESLLKSDIQINVIVDSAGTGKTTALLKIAEKFKAIHKTCLVLHYDLNSNEMSDKFSSMKSNQKISKKNANLILRRYFFSKYTNFELAVILYLLQNNKVIFCLDGFDEKSQKYDNKCISLIQQLQSVAKQIWLTSRQHMESYIQQHLLTFPIRLLPMTPQDQIDFYMKYFKGILGNDKDIEDFATQICASIARADDSIVEVIGIPLLTKMLASINHTKVLDYNDSTIETKLAPVELTNLYDLYYQFFDQSSIRFMKEKKKENLKSPYCNLNKEERLQQHMLIAFASLMNDHFHSLFTEQEKELIKNNSEYEKQAAGFGIMTSLDEDKAIFLHFTFAEFLVASFISYTLNNCKFNSKRQTILDEVLHNDRWKMVRKFLNNSPDILRFSQDNVEMNQNRASVSGHSVCVINEICAKYNPLVKCAINRKTSLHIAVEEKNCNIAKFTIECLQDSEREKYISFQTERVSSFVEKQSALHLAVYLGHKEEADLLLNYNDDNFNEEDSRDELLMTAAEQGHVDVVTVLLDRGADINYKYENGKTALLRAAEEGHVDVVTLLLDRGADVHGADEVNMTAILTAAEWSTVETVKLLQARGASLDDKAKDGRTLLLWAAMNKRHDVITYVLSQGRCDIHDRDNDGQTALHHAADCGHSLNVKTLLDSGADINSQDDAGETPLHTAVKSRWSRLQCVQYLCQRGADRRVKNKSGQTVLDVECYRHDDNDSYVWCDDEIKQWLRQNINICDIEVQGELTNDNW